MTCWTDRSMNIFLSSDFLHRCKEKPQPQHLPEAIQMVTNASVLPVMSLTYHLSLTCITCAASFCFNPNLHMSIYVSSLSITRLSPVLLFPPNCLTCTTHLHLCCTWPFISPGSPPPASGASLPLSSSLCLPSELHTSPVLYLPYLSLSHFLYLAYLFIPVFLVIYTSYLQLP